ncbi:MAG: leucine dehydrogenase [Haliea sp.]|nr:leucine dehydrogenase [Haliea sp.]
MGFADHWYEREVFEVVFDIAKSYNPEQIVYCNDEESGLRAIIVIHDTTFGPAAGGTRMYDYPSEEAALTDALRLAQGMTRKCAMARAGVGGAKAVIMGDPGDKTEAMLRSYGRFVERLNGVFITGNDVNILFEDAKIIAEETGHVLGASDRLGPSAPVTSHGVFCGMRACVEEIYGGSDMNGLTVAVQGMGSVGYELARELHREGAQLIVTDINDTAAARAAEEFGARVVAADEIYGVEADVFAPCAMGAVINDSTIEQLRCRIVAGAANNQLATCAHGDELFRRGILYAPDYVVNAGGAIYVRLERTEPEATSQTLIAAVEIIGETMEEVIATAKAKNAPTHSTADQIADERVLREKERKCVGKN